MPLAHRAGAAKFFTGYPLSGAGKHAIAANCTHQAIMASLVVDAAYVHHGTAAASADNINGWSEAALKRIKPKAFKRRLESALGLSIERACWCAARDGRVDAVATKLDK